MKTCTRCGQRQALDNFYFVSRKLGTRRGQCKACMSEIKQAQKDPAWRPACARCGRERDRSGPGRRLCTDCFSKIYDAEDRRLNGAHRRRLNPCSCCGARRLREDHLRGTSLCPVCRSVPQSRRKRLKEFNLTPPEYLALLDAQGHRCAICRRKPTTALHIDHRHAAPSIVRGLLCNRCNTMLATARDSTELLQAAAEYLEIPGAQALFPGRVVRPEANRREFVPLRRAA